ncbi:MAG TPA: ABC transporter permease [Bacillota bacterium]|nr:ABC transporter permease [Bacillota bacterium]
MLKAWTIAVLTFLVAPVVLLVPVALSSSSALIFPPPGFSLRWFQTFFQNPQWLSSMFFSLRISLWVALLATGLAILASFALVRGSLRRQGAVYAIILAPLITPEIIVAIALYFIFARVHLVGTELAIILGQAVLALPVATILVSTTLQGLDVRTEQAAMVHGATPLRTFWLVTLPLLAPGVATAALFAFLGSFDELLVALFMVGPLQQTLPVRIWDFVQFELQPVIAAVSVMVTLLAITVLALGAWLQGRSSRSGAQDAR